MKIDTDLRLAIKSVIANRKTENTWKQRFDREKKAITELFSNPRHSANVRAAKRSLEKSRKLRLEGIAVFNTLGISEDEQYIRDEAKFKRAGGRLIDPPEKSITFDQLMAKLAQASNQEAGKLLVRFGIKWTQ